MTIPHASRFVRTRWYRRLDCPRIRAAAQSFAACCRSRPQTSASRKTFLPEKEDNVRSRKDRSTSLRIVQRLVEAAAQEVLAEAAVVGEGSAVLRLVVKVEVEAD